MLSVSQNISIFVNLCNSTYLHVNIVIRFSTFRTSWVRIHRASVIKIQLQLQVALSGNTLVDSVVKEREKKHCVGQRFPCPSRCIHFSRLEGFKGLRFTSFTCIQNEKPDYRVNTNNLFSFLLEAFSTNILCCLFMYCILSG